MGPRAALCLETMCKGWAQEIAQLVEGSPLDDADAVHAQSTVAAELVIGTPIVGAARGPCLGRSRGLPALIGFGCDLRSGLPSRVDRIDRIGRPLSQTKSLTDYPGLEWAQSPECRMHDCALLILYEFIFRCLQVGGWFVLID